MAQRANVSRLCRQEALAGAQPATLTLKGPKGQHELLIKTLSQKMKKGFEKGENCYLPRIAEPGHKSTEPSRWVKDGGSITMETYPLPICGGRLPRAASPCLLLTPSPLLLSCADDGGFAPQMKAGLL